MLIRPVFFKLLGIVLGKDTDMSSIDDLLALAARCLEVAKCNMRIVTTLSDLSLLGRDPLSLRSPAAWMLTCV
jgi:hypothetical protein